MSSKMYNMNFWDKIYKKMMIWNWWNEIDKVKLKKWNWKNENDEMKLKKWNWFDKIDLIKLI